MIKVKQDEISKSKKEQKVIYEELDGSSGSKDVLQGKSCGEVQWNV